MARLPVSETNAYAQKGCVCTKSNAPTPHTQIDRRRSARRPIVHDVQYFPNVRILLCILCVGSWLVAQHTPTRTNSSKWGFQSPWCTVHILAFAQTSHPAKMEPYHMISGVPPALWLVAQNPLQVHGVHTHSHTQTHAHPSRIDVILPALWSDVKLYILYCVLCIHIIAPRFKVYRNGKWNLLFVLDE